MDLAQTTKEPREERSLIQSSMSLGKAADTVSHSNPGSHRATRGRLIYKLAVLSLTFTALWKCSRRGWPRYRIFDFYAELCIDILKYVTSSLSAYQQANAITWGDALSAYGRFPKPDDPFNFIPCSGNDFVPPLNDTDPHRTWAKQFNPSPGSWNWGPASAETFGKREEGSFAGRAIYLCGWLDVPLDYTNDSDPRIARLAVTKYQVSGLASEGSIRESSASQKSERTLMINPGGPGGSGTASVWATAERVTQTLSLGRYDVLGWDPRGVNMSLPQASCFPHDYDRDRWSLFANKNRAEAANSSESQLVAADALNEATFAACKTTLGDLGRFVGTAFVARDVDQILTALNETELTGRFVSYGTGIGQTFANMFPDRVGRLILDGTEYVRDHRLVGGFGWTALDNGTDAWNDGFLGECIKAGPANCQLAKPVNGSDDSVSLSELQTRMSNLISSLIDRSRPAFTRSSGPSLITHSMVVSRIYGAMYNPFTWPTMAHALYDLEMGNTTRMAQLLEGEWEYSPSTIPERVSTDELGSLVICADSYDAPKPWEDDEDDAGPLTWWSDLWQNMTKRSWVAGDSRFYNVLPCRHFTEHFGAPAEVYRGDLNHTLSNRVLLVAETYDPATPLRNGRRLLAEMGDNARLIVHHGYGHSARDSSNCTDEISRRYILEGVVPKESETNCFANEKPYRYNDAVSFDLQLWREHVRDMRRRRWGE